ncbi:hypothetical protein [Wenyingzhuangia sp. IMCC45574]
MKNILEAYIRIIKRIGSNKILVLIGAFSALVSLLTFFGLTDERLYYTFTEKYNLPIANEKTFLLFISIAFGSFAIIYLQSGGKKKRYDEDEINDFNERKINNLTKEINDLKKSIKTIKTDYNFNDSDKASIEGKIIDNLTTETLTRIFDSKITDIKNDLEAESSFTRVLDSSKEIVSRLKREIKDLRLRANINLVFGLIITFGGLWLLWSTVNIIDSSELLKQLASEGNDSNYKFLKNLFIPIVPRILLVLFIEIFSYFFLKLYKQGLTEIKFFQNELTNIESKLSAVSFSYATNEKETLRSAILSLANTERNHSIKEKVESKDSVKEKDLLNKLSELISKVVKNEG